ncbi:MAG: hypothetical protein HYT86_09025 [candidate division NC10 bacterium]|nr:hypothetical protein [candidate division NC10 bacterium]
MSAADAAPVPRSGASSIIGTTHRSWKIRIPRTHRPWGESISARSTSVFRTTAVLLRARRNPKNVAGFQSVTQSAPIAAVAAMVARTWAVPPPQTARPIWLRRVRENSIPMVKRRRTTPISASTSTEWTSATRLRP